MAFAKISIGAATIICVATVVLIGGCSQPTSSISTRVPHKLSQSKSEIDQQRRLVLTHQLDAPVQIEPEQSKQTWVCQTDLPILHIASSKEAIADEPKVSATLKINERGLEPVCMPIAIEWRGKTSQTFPKKSYGFELRSQDDPDSTVKQSLLGMRKDDDWILDALWNEPVSIRDFTAHQIWRQMAADHLNRDDYDLPQQRYCELFLDGVYCGIYYLGERVDRKMLKLKKPDGQSQGQLFKAVAWEDGSSFKAAPPLLPGSPQWSGFEAVYPQPRDEVDWSALRSVVTLVADTDSVEFGTTIGRTFELDNAIDYFIFTNLLAAMDNRGKNYFLVRQSASSPWFFVPWDLDLTAGICFPMERKDVVKLPMYNELFRRAMRQPEFVQAATERWNYLRAGLFKEENLKSLYRQNYQHLTDNGVYDRQRRYPELRADFDSPEREMEYLEHWLEKRIDFLDSWLGNTTRLVKRLQRDRNSSPVPIKR